MRRYPNLKTIAFIGNYLPRRCGIATFTNDLLQAVTDQINKRHALERSDFEAYIEEALP